MAQQVIGLGAAANDGTGDTLRVAGEKINANFTELYNPVQVRVNKTVPQGGQTVFFVNPPAAMPNGAGGNDSASAAILVTSGMFSQGPASQQTYWDTVISIGLNFRPDGQLPPLNPQLPTPRFAIESKFANPSQEFITEFHLVSVLNTPGAGEFRGFSATVPHDATKWATDADMYFRAAKYNITNGSGAKTISMDFSNGSTPNISLEGPSTYGVRIKQLTNNTPWLQQFNKDRNLFLSLPFIDRFDRLLVAQPVTLNPGPMKPGVLGVTSGLEGAFTGAVNNSYLQYFYNSTAVTGRMFGAFFSSLVTGAFLNSIRNITSGGRAGYKATVTNGTGFLEFEDLSASRRFALRHDPDNGGTLRVDNSVDGANPTRSAFSIPHVSMQMQFANAPRLPSFTVAALPSASAMGAGALAMCSNDAGGPVVVFSDGTNWRRVTDRAVAAV